MKKNYLPIALFSFLSLFTQLGTSGQIVNTYSTPGTYNYTVLSQVTSITVEVWGGGGGGGSCTNGVGGGGGGGGYSKITIANPAPGTYSLVVGAGGTAGVAGGRSYFINTSTVLANGGAGVSNNTTAGGVGATLGLGDLPNIYKGGNGANGDLTNKYGGGGGGSAGQTLNGNNAVKSPGGAVVRGGGKGGNGNKAKKGGNGKNGNLPGGGGGGAYITGTGGKGGDGKVTITFTQACNANFLIWNGGTAPTEKDWFTPGNWCKVTGKPNLIPNSTIDVYIPSTASFQPIINADASCRSIFIDGSLTVAGANTLQVNGDWTNQGVFSAGTGTVNFNGTSDNILGGDSTTNFYNLAITKGTNQINSTVSAFSTIKDVTLNSGSLILSSTDTNYIIGGNVLLTNGTALTASDDQDINVAGNWTNNSTFNPNNSTVYFTGGLNDTLLGTSTTTFNNLVVNKDVGKTLTINKAFSSLQDLTINQGNLLLTSTDANYNIGGDISIKGVLTAPAAQNILVAGDWTKSGTFNFNTSNVIFNGSSDQGITGLTTFYNAAKSTSDTLTLNNNVIITNIFAFAAGATVDMNGKNLTLKTINGTTNFKGSTLSNLTISSSSPALNFLTGFQSLNNLTLSANSSLGTPLTVNGSLSLTTSLFTIGGNDLTLTPSATVGGAARGANNMIIATGSGRVVKQFSGINSFTYPIGGSSPGEYSPVNLTFTDGTFGANANVAINVRNTKQPNNTTSPTDYINRYWNVSTNNITGYKANTSFTYLVADLPTGSTEANIKTGGLAADNVWYIGNNTNSATHTLSVTGETNLNKSYTGVNFTAANVYFRSISNGFWSNASNWQSSSTGTSFWNITMVAPTSAASGILIKSGDSISVNSSVSLGKTQLNGNLNLQTGGLITLANAADALTINSGGAFNITTTTNYGSASFIPGSGKITVNGGGKIVAGNGNSSPITGGGFDALANNINVWKTDAVFEWNIPGRQCGNLSYFSSTSADIPIFRITNHPPAQPTSIPALYGILEVNTPVLLQGDGRIGFSTIFRNGIRSLNRSTLSLTNNPVSSTNLFRITADNALLNNINLNMNSGSLSIEGNTISSDSVNILGTQNIIISSGKSLSINGVFDVADRNISGAGGLTLNATGVYRTTNSGGFSGAGSSLTTSNSSLQPGSTVELYASGDQTFNSRNDFANIIFSGSGTKTIAGANFAPAGTVTMKNNIIVNSGTTNIGGPSSNLTMIDGSRFIVNNSGLQPAFGGIYNISLTGIPSYIQFNGDAGQTIRGNGVIYNRLEVTGAGVSNAGQNISMLPNGIFIVNNGGIYNSGNNAIKGSGTGPVGTHWGVVVANGGTFMVGNDGGFNGILNKSAIDMNTIDTVVLVPGSTVNYSGINQVITIPTTTDYSNLVLSGTGNKTAPADSLSIKGDFTKTGSALFLSNGGKIAFNGGVGQTFYSTGAKQLVFNNFTNNNTAGLTINDSMAVYKEMYLGLNSKLILKDSVTLKSDDLNTANIPPIQHDNAITYDSKANTSGSFIVERYMPVTKKAWHILARPTKGSTIKASWQEGSTIPNGNPKPGFGINITSNGPTPLDKGFDAVSTLPSVKTYTANNYVGIPNTTGNADGLQAYYVFVRGDRSVTTATTGGPTILRTMGKIYIPGTESPQPVTVKDGEFAMIGNPYPSAIKFDKIVTRTNLKQFYYVWDPKLTGDFGTGAFRTISADGLIQVPLDPVGPAYPSLIESGQGFFVQASTGGGSIGFDENAKVTGSNNRVFSFAKQTSDQPIAQIRGNIYSSATGTRVLLDGVLTQFNSEFTNSLNLADGEKLDIPSESMGIRNGGEIIAIGRRAMPTQKDSIFYDFKQLKYSNYELQLIASYMEITGMNAYLKDKYLNTDQRLNDGINTINIQIDNIAGSKAADRFFVYFKPSSTLPVTLLSLNAVEKNGDVIVTWNVENEKDMLDYIVEVSADGNQFNKGGVVSSRNLNAGVYQWTDVSAKPGYHYYRLKMTGKDGKINYSAIVKVFIGNSEGKPSISIYPNPIVNNEIRVQLENLPAGLYKGRLLNNAGQFVQAMEFNHAGGNSIELLKVGNKLAAGVYHLEISKNGEKVFAGKVICP